MKDWKEWKDRRALRPGAFPAGRTAGEQAVAGVVAGRVGFASGRDGSLGICPVGAGGLELEFGCQCEVLPSRSRVRGW